MLDRRDFLKASAGFLATLGLAPLIKARPETLPRPCSSLGSNDQWMIQSDGVEIGPKGRTILQLEPKLNRNGSVFEVQFFTDLHKHSTPITWLLTRQKKRVSREPALGISSSCDTVDDFDFYAWQDGEFESHQPIMSQTLDPMTYFRWITGPGGEIRSRHPQKLAIVARCEEPTTCYATLIGRNRRPSG
jgi:hypothetical protein